MKIDKYDAGRGVYYAVDIDELEKEYKSLGLTDEEITTKKELMRQKVAKKVAEVLGADPATITLTSDKDGKISIEATKKVKEEKI